MAIDFIKAMADPYSVDTGNKALQGATVSKTVQYGLFTNNRNAVWAARNQLQKESFPFVVVSCLVNRDMFRLQVGDLFLYDYPPHGISGLVVRVLKIEEESLDSENIVVHGIQDFFSIAAAITQYSDPEDRAGQPQEYETDPFTKIAILEAPYTPYSDKTAIIPVAGRENALDSGFVVYMSVDGGTSYSVISTSINIQPYGTLNSNYGITYTIDDYEGIEIDFESGVNTIESVTWADVLSGNKNTAVLGDEIISFRTITPVSGTVYLLEDVIRGRLGTVKEAHTAGEDFFFIPKSVGTVSHSEIIPGATRFFKLVPFNVKKAGSISEATPFELEIEGESSKPYEPINFNAESEAFNPLYTSGDDITLTWSVRKRGEGCGIGIPGVEVTVGTAHEGLFTVEVWVSTVLVRTTTGIDAATWVYTNTMNVADNTTPADEILFKIVNYIVDGMTFESDAVEVYCRKE